MTYALGVKTKLFEKTNNKIFKKSLFLICFFLFLMYNLYGRTTRRIVLRRAERQKTESCQYDIIWFYEDLNEGWG